MNTALRLLLHPPSFLFNIIAKTRQRLYDNGVFEIIDTGVPVLSIGNLSMGGTGKTPITSYIVRDLQNSGWSPAIVSRGYRAQERGPAIVPPGASARMFGDEPAWLAKEHPSVPVVIGAKRPEAIAFLLSARAGWKDRRIVVADDAFQHRRLKRDLDAVVIDATEPELSYRPVPLGRLREGFDALKRAQVVFISKVNQAPTAQTLSIRKNIPPGLLVVEWTIEVDHVFALGSGERGDLRAKKVALVSAIGRPESFKKSVAPLVGGVVEHFVFRDHHSYSAGDLASIERDALAIGAEVIVVTQKDAVKLAGWSPKIPVFVTNMQAKPGANYGEFRAILDRLA